ncbi:MAG: PQQ-binding-like beta-propeller repeat protein [Kiritimatiellaeota bacterium]|nr:PQQ-binding-like beta-propeller repeat protein [Kiritimatiellota bacterium]
MSNPLKALQKARSVGLASLVGLLDIAPLHGAVLVGRVDVTPSGGSFDERPKAVVVNQTPGAGLFASENNRGDWAIGAGVGADGSKPRPLPQNTGVAIVSLNELVPRNKRGGLEACGKLTTGQASTVVPGSFWVAGFTAEGGGAEANYDFALAFFPFEDGWTGAYVAADGHTLTASGNLPAGTVLRRFTGGTFAGEIELRLPGIDSRYDGILFAVGGENGDNVTAVGPLADGTGWHIRIADESQDYRSEERAAFSFLYLPYRTLGLTAGRVLRDGTVGQTAGEFVVTHKPPGRYEIFIPGASDRDGILLLEITQLNKEGVEDNAAAWAFDPEAGNGRGAFVVETYDQPSFASQDAGFCFAFVPYAAKLTPAPGPTGFSPAATWADSMLRARRLLADRTRDKTRFRPWIGPVMRPGRPAQAASLSVPGVPHLWLSADALDGKGNAPAVWGDPRFVLADGRVRFLADMKLLFARVESAELQRRPATVAGTTFRRAVLAPASSLLGVEIPAGAVRFETAAGIENTGNAGNSVRFRIGDLPYHRSYWAEVIWPVLRQTFPYECRRLDRDFKAVGGGRALDFENCLPRLQEGIAALRTELGALADPPRRPIDPTDIAAVLRRYGALCGRIERLNRAKKKLWRDVPVLSSLLDYPDPGLNGLRGKLAAIAKEKPALEADVAARQKDLDVFERLLVGTLRALTDKDPAALDPVRQAVPLLEHVAEWTDAKLGWNTLGGNNQRNFVSRESLPASPVVLWRHVPRAPPAPAWPPPARENWDVRHKLSPATTFDRAFHAVVSRNALVYGSSSSDAIVCLSADTGREQWRFFTQGPVRLAPAIYRDRVYAGADDGYLYCLDLATGREIWRFRAGGERDARLMGNGRIISQWPVRCGICVAGGRVYFGAGVFPSMGTFLYALDAESGEEKWKRALASPPQGPLLLSPDRLFVPTGRTPFRMFARADGRSIGALGSSNSWGKDLPGGSSAVIVREKIITGPGEGGALHLFDLRTSTSVVKTAGRRVVVDGMTTFILHGDRIAALARPDYIQGRNRPERLWETPCRSGYSMLKTAGRLIVGTDDGITILDSSTGKTTARVSLPGGRAEGLAINRGRLYVSMGDGSIFCLGAPRSKSGQTAPSTGMAAKAIGRSVPDAKAREAARALREWCGFRKGWILAVGRAADPELIQALALETEMRIVACLRTAGAARALREKLDRAGLLGTRATVHTVSGRRLPYRPYLFNLIVAPESGLDPAELFRVLRPSGGCLAASAEAASSGVPRPPGALEPPPRLDSISVGFRRGPIPGAGAWAAQYADGANTSSSNDQLPYGPFEVLWFGRPGPRYMLDRHWKGQAPLCSNGTLLIIGWNYLAAADAYNGAVLWEKHVQGTGRTAIPKDCGSAVAADGRLYVAAKGRCLVYHVRSGRREAELPVKRYAPAAARWGYVGISGDRLIGSGTRDGAIMEFGKKSDYRSIWYNNAAVVTSLSIFGVDLADPATAWRYTPEHGVVVNPTVTLLNGKVLFVESTNPDAGKDPDGKLTPAELWRGGPRLTALDSTDGSVKWSVPIDLDRFDNTVYMSGKDGVLVLTGTWVGKIDGKRLIQYRLIGVSVADGRELWRSDDTPSFADRVQGGHGEQTQHPAIVGDVVYGPGFARTLKTGAAWKGWKWNKGATCSTLSASAFCAFSRRLGNPTIESFADGKQRRLTRATRPACLINILPAAGLVLIPEGSSGCTCGYALQTTLALHPAPQP